MKAAKPGEIKAGELPAMQERIQLKFSQAQENLERARKTYSAAKQSLVAFNNKYGRVIEILRED